MSLYVVVHQNPYFPRGSYVEELEDDVEEGFEVDSAPAMVQKVVMRPENGRWVPVENVGVALPLYLVREYLLKIQKRGLDKRW